jgi:2'-5' RNA ligase
LSRDNPGRTSCRVGEVARGFAPFSFRFDKVERFPNSAVYYLAPREASPFHEFQRRLASSGLRFAPVEFSYVPHCTIAILSQGAPAEAHAETLACPVPTEDILVSSVSFWSVDHERQEARQGETLMLGT